MNVGFVIYAKKRKQMDAENGYIMEELLVRYCEGKVSEEEAAYVKRWIKASDGNRRMAQRINRLCLAADTLELEDKLDVERAFKKVQGRKAARRLRLAGLWMQRVAAVLLLPMLALYLVLLFDRQHGEVQLVEVHTHPGMSSSLTLPDGTLVYLNSSSSITYPACFNGDTRNVSLKGEAYFEVTKDSDKRFIVSTPHNAHVEVLGTRFNLEAYEESNLVMATLLEGKICFACYAKDKGKSITLNPGNKVIYDVETDDVQLQRTTGVCETGWIQGKIILENTPLEESLRLLGKHFHTDFIISNPKLKEYSFTGTFANQGLERVLEKFRLSSRIKWRYLNEEDDTEGKTRIEIY